MKKKVLFIDRDGTIVKEPPVDYQLDALEKFELIPHVIRSLAFLRNKGDFEMVMVSNQDGLGTSSFPTETFLPPHELMLKTLEGEGITWDAICIDPTMPDERAATRKPGIALLSRYQTEEYDLAGSFVIGDRLTDVELAFNLGCKAILLLDPQAEEHWLEEELKSYTTRSYNGERASALSPEALRVALKETIALATSDWDRITEFLFAGERTARVERNTKETQILVELNVDGSGKCDISTGLGFFDHMLEQIGKHGGMDLTIHVTGDLYVDEHHTIEDTGLALGECLLKALGNKRGIERYGYCLPMDDCLCQVALDFGGRPWMVWDAEFRREKIGEMPTEMFFHFFKSLSDTAKMNLNIKAEGGNEHHKIEGIFKALARALKMAVKRDIYHYELPSSKGVL